MDFKGREKKQRPPPEWERKASVDAGISLLFIPKPRLVIQLSVCGWLSVCSVPGAEKGLAVRKQLNTHRPSRTSPHHEPPIPPLFSTSTPFFFCFSSSSLVFTSTAVFRKMKGEDACVARQHLQSGSLGIPPPIEPWRTIWCEKTRSQWTDKRDKSMKMHEEQKKVNVSLSRDFTKRWLFQAERGMKGPRVLTSRESPLVPRSAREPLLVCSASRRSALGASQPANTEREARKTRGVIDSSSGALPPNHRARGRRRDLRSHRCPARRGRRRRVAGQSGAARWAGGELGETRRGDNAM
ncbi:unnamed protein product [Pleuronectes platessa]|uniref:Uncharacterized protein n=1 Tax=Pleuronectes platessa TaxID=8262 RepID=A0A9N7VYM4_PLEPL|nr:unnamed protein product [Pleuronectes platessa]